MAFLRKNYVPNFCNGRHPPRSTISFSGQNLHYVIVLMTLGEHKRCFAIFISRFQLNFALQEKYAWLEVISLLKMNAPQKFSIQRFTFSHRILTQLTFPDRQAR